MIDLKNIFQLEALTERTRPLYGQISLGIILLAGIYLSFNSGQVMVGERGHFTTMLGWLPESLLSNQLLFNACKYIFCIAAVLWVFRLFVPWTSWLATISYIAFNSLYLENSIL